MGGKHPTISQDAPLPIIQAKEGNNNLPGLQAGDLVLDLGCGSCRAMQRFRELGIRTHGVTLGSNDVAVCRGLGFTVTEAPLELVGSMFPAESFDMIFARHSLEHTVVPMFLLDELKALVRPSGTLYLEVPMPETSSEHEHNVNHYSVFGAEMWRALLLKLGFVVVEHAAIELYKSEETKRHKLPPDDLYWYALAKKKNKGGGGRKEEVEVVEVAV